MLQVQIQMSLERFPHLSFDHPAHIPLALAAARRVANTPTIVLSAYSQLLQLGFGVNDSQIISEISKVVHKHPYFTRFNVDSLLNFAVYLHHPKKRIGFSNSYRTGSVTFQTEQVAKLFLELCGGVSPRIRIIAAFRPIEFKPSKFPAKSHVVENIRKLSFSDPLELQRQEEKLRLLGSSVVHLTEIQFGWECRDEVFSVEYARRTPCNLYFSRLRRQFEISLAHEDGYHQNIVVSLSQIQRVAASKDAFESSVIFHLASAPRFELGPVLPVIESGDDQSQDPRHNRLRMTSLKSDVHQRVVAYVSSTLRILCSPSEYDQFVELWELSEAHLTILHTNFRVEYREAFSQKYLEEVQRWVEFLGWPLAFQVDACLRNGTMDPKEILQVKPDIEELLKDEGEEHCAGLLRFYREQLQMMWYSEASQSQESVKDCFQRCRDEYRHSPAPVAEGLFYCLHVFITPSGVRLDGPFPEQTNRVIRKYPENKDHFLRVTFVEEDNFRFRFDTRTNARSFIDSHVGGILRNGLTIAGRRFEFLHYSQSALKDHAVWFILPFDDASTKCRVDAKSIIESLGTFTDLQFDKKLIYCPARYAARISQAFTTTDSSISIDPGEIIIEDDIIGETGSCFTDGVGTVSRELADEMWKLLCAKKRRGFRSRGHPRPRAFQIRFRGSKGMISVDHTLPGRVLVLRPSMIKFEAAEKEIEIAGVFNKPRKMLLNRPLIMLLEGLGVSGHIFLELQKQALQNIKDATGSLETISTVFENYGLGQSFRLTSCLQKLAGLRPGWMPCDAFYNKVTRVAIFHILRDLKHRARIPVPGWTLVGVADVHSYLKEGEVFVCIEEERGRRKFLEGLVCISRSPTIHPGDVQVARAIGAPPPDSPFLKEALANSLVFATKGKRSLPSCLGGGDLDGDLYNITDYRELLPRTVYPPASYATAERKELDHPSTRDDVIDFIVDYINADNVGIIATNWLIIADQSLHGIHDPDCLKLAKLHSDAVEYAKTGRAVPMDQVPRLQHPAKPDWAEPEIGESSELGSIKYYPSQRAIGRLYREIDLSEASVGLMLEDSRPNRLSGMMHRLSLHRDTHEDGPKMSNPLWKAVKSKVEEFTEDLSISEKQSRNINDIFRKYCQELQWICSTYTINNRRHSRLTEAEVFVGTIKTKTPQRRRRSDLIGKLRERTMQLVTDVKYDLVGDDDMPKLGRLRLAWAAWQLSIKEQKFGAASFFWVALSSLFDAIKSIEEEDIED
ncbi:RdRP-domain-containing protein [Sanghuangporus baumii]|uniref:RNA-dependent RNA polymerase n=1 Tax=Sanghuangporus baumii TaxID=108892 RepID=A0A9Q5HU81_SANBA|nr:RdRP-domain-containing protein [Sanghuangporus baumii]